VEEAREIGARGQRIRGGDDDSEGEEREVENRNLDKVWGENERGVSFGKFENCGEVCG